MRKGILFYLIFHVTSLYADIAITPFLGISTAILNPSNLYLSGEIDGVHPDKYHEINALWGGGIGYVKRNWQWGVMYYNQSMHQNGDVWLYELPDFNAFRYRMTVASQSLMTFAQYQWELEKSPFIPFFYAALGGARQQASYVETPTSSDTIDAIFFDESDKMHLSYALGLGTKLNIKQKSYISIQYQYMDAGKILLQNTSNASLSMSMHQHLLLLGYTFFI